MNAMMDSAQSSQGPRNHAPDVQNFRLFLDYPKAALQEMWVSSYSDGIQGARLENEHRSDTRCLLVDVDGSTIINPEVIPKSVLSILNIRSPEDAHIMQEKHKGMDTFYLASKTRQMALAMMSSPEDLSTHFVGNR